MTRLFQKIQVIANPASGQTEPVLSKLNAVFKAHEADWQIDVTHEKGDGAALARRALEQDVDLVAVYGGDGTVGDVASGMVGASVPLAILPGGTGNALAKGLGISTQLEQAAEQIFNSSPQPLDMGTANGQLFVLRADMGLSTATTRDASQELKESLGMLAYLVAALQSLGEVEPIQYRLTVDEQVFDSQGIACIVTNHYELGGFGLKFSDTVKADDGLLDVFVVHDMSAILALVTAPLTQREPDTVLAHWQGKQIRVESDISQAVHLDGDPFDKTPINIEVVPGAVQVLIPNNPPT